MAYMTMATGTGQATRIPASGEAVQREEEKGEGEGIFAEGEDPRARFALPLPSSPLVSSCGLVRNAY